MPICAGRRNYQQDPVEIIEELTADAPVDVELLAKRLGLKLDKDAKLPEGISGQLMRLKDQNYKISVNKKEHIYRRRFTIAHEIGHYILHKDIVDFHGGVDDNVMYRSTKDGNLYNDEIDEFHEKQANSFAANILMPKNLVRHIISEKSSSEKKISLEELYRHFKVSPSAMKWRLGNLKLSKKVSGLD